MSLLPGMNERTSTIVAAWVDPRGAGSRDESGTRARIPGDASRYWRPAHNAPDRAAYGSAYAEDANACATGARNEGERDEAWTGRRPAGCPPGVGVAVVMRADALRRFTARCRGRTRMGAAG